MPMNPRPLVLIAEDDPGILASVRDYLVSKGFDVHVAEDGLQAVIQAAKLKPAVILLDFDMPAASGEVVFRRLRSASSTAFTPLLFVTGKLDALKRTSIQEGERVRFLRKPAALADIEAAIRRLLGMLEAAPSAPSAPQPASLRLAQAAAPAGAARHVLIIDDDKTVLEVLRAQLESAGFEAAACEDGRRGIEHLKGHPVDLVLLDVMLPGESGLDVCRAIRGASGGDYLPIILLTAKGGTESMVEGLEAGADEYLVKPHRVPELLARIRSMLRFKDAMDRLRWADAFKEELLAITAHDLRNPASAIKGFAEFLLGDAPEQDEDKRRKALEIILKNADFMILLLDRLYRKTRFESAELSAAKVPADPAALVAGLVERNAPLAQSRRVRLEHESRLPSGYAAPLDPGLFEEITANLIGNALKFTPAGGAVRVSLASRGGCLALAVADTGPGILPDEQKAVFEKFRRATGSRIKEGMGYGLAIVSKFARLHGGRVELESAPGRGCTFTVFFPEG